MKEKCNLKKRMSRIIDKMKQEKIDTIEINDYLDYTSNGIDEVVGEILEAIPLRDNISYAGYEKKEWISCL